MKRFRFPAFMALVLVLAGVLVPSAPAAAHPYSLYFTQGMWTDDATISYGLNQGFPGGDFANRMYDGKNHWNNADTGQEPQTYWTLTDYIPYGSFSNPCGLATGGNNRGVLFWIDLDNLGSGVAGATLACKSGSTWIKASMAIDSDQPWYPGTDGVPGTHLDLWSVATHEFGHWNGFWVHWAEGMAGICPPAWDSNRHTMCPSISPGTYVQRHTKTHDIHTFQGAY